MQQYNRIKKQCSDAVLFFRMGDFYEMFFEDAEESSSLLGIVLTARGKAKGNSIPLCGVPHHTAAARAVMRGTAHALHDLLYAEVLLIAGHLLLAGIEQGVRVSQFQDAFRPAQIEDRSVLACDFTRLRFQTIKVLPDIPEPFAEELVFLLIIERPIHGCRQIVVILFPPDRPEFSGGPGRSV